MKRTSRFTHIQTLLDEMEVTEEKINYMEVGIGNEIVNLFISDVKAKFMDKTLRIKNRTFELYKVTGSPWFYGENYVNIHIVLIEINFKSKLKHKLLDEFYKRERTNPYGIWMSSSKNAPYLEYDYRLGFKDIYEDNINLDIYKNIY